MTVAYSDYIDVLLAIRTRLRYGIPEFTEKTCFICDTPIPPMIPSGELACTICDGGVQYDENTYMGAAGNALDNGMTVLVTILERCALDTPTRTEVALTDDLRGILRWRRPVLTCLLVDDDQDCEGYKDQWTMLDEDGNYILRERGLIPRGWSPASYQTFPGDRTFLSMTLSLTANFDQEL